MIPERLAFVDLETTGANAAHDRITEIGVVEVDGDDVSTWTTLVNPGRAIPQFIQQLTGISNEMVADAPSFADVAHDLAARLHGRVFIAHNARFDYGFLKNEFQRLGLRFRADVLCTVRLSRRMYPEHHRHNLDSLIERHGLATFDRHRALADADLIWQFWNVLKREHEVDAIADAVAHQLARPACPPHLDPAVFDDLPESPGVYRFYGENDLLLYVGKSVNLRQRVLSHFSADTREYKAMNLTQQLRRIDWQETVGEFGALLLESRLVKAMQPFHNRRLRREPELCAWRLDEVAPGDFRPVLVSADEPGFGHAGDLFGPFPSRRQATTTLRKLADAHQLCPTLLGLEKSGREGSACFTLQVAKCRGACAGRESVGLHSARLMAALAKLKMAAWDYPGAIALVERDDFTESEDIHVIDGWRYLGTAKTEADVHALLEQSGTAPFDLDTYKLLKTQIKKGKLAVRALSAPTAADSM